MLCMVFIDLELLINHFKKENYLLHFTFIKV